MTALNEDRLQKYFDGELADEDAEVVRGALEDDAALRAKLEGLSHLRAMMKAAADERGSEVDADALFASIEARLEDDVVDDEPMFPEAAPVEAAPRPKLAVVAGGKEPAPAAKAEPAAPRRTGLIIGVGATLAAAAALLLWVMQPGDRATPMADDGGTLAEVDPPPGSEVEEVDFGYQTGAIFSVEGNEGEQYAVVWISDEKAIVDEEAEERIQ